MANSSDFLYFKKLRSNEQRIQKKERREDGGCVTVRGGLDEMENLAREAGAVSMHDEILHRYQQACESRAQKNMSKKKRLLCMNGRAARDLLDMVMKPTQDDNMGRRASRSKINFESYFDSLYNQASAVINQEVIH